MTFALLPSRLTACWRSHPGRRHTALLRATLALMLTAAGPVSAASPEPTTVCAVPSTLTVLRKALPHLSKKLAADGPVTIVALGSSSTFGFGASSPAATYPSRLEAELKQLYPGHAIKVVNKGVNGNETRDELQRFERDVLAEKPDLVIWQVGTNTLLNGHDMWPVFLNLENGIRRLRDQGADVVLMNMQYSPKVLSRPNHDDMLELIKVASKELDVEVFDRFAIMRNWASGQHLAFDRFITPDGLHMNDWGYGCIAHLLAGAITTAGAAEVARSPVPGAGIAR
ncbi:MAG: SGNH/GDSL hydrolase family protein [Ancalomicrobiaceae bacterium]|nr:SGNH/GDSL hydrolase family protein [Ancalomicrobiaceae bacterium]